MKIRYWLVVPLIIGLLVAAAYVWQIGIPGWGGKPIWTAGPTITNLQALSELVTTRVNVLDKLSGQESGCRGVWIVKGDALLSVDMKKAKIVKKDGLRRQATIRLPRPRVLSARVNHELTEEVLVENKNWYWPGDKKAFRAKALKKAQQLVEAAAKSEENLDRAREHAKEAIKNLYGTLGWDVTVEWDDAHD